MPRERSRYPEAGGSSSFARHAFNELISFGAALGADARLRRHGRDVGVLRPALPLDLLGAAEDEPMGHRRRRVVIVDPRVLNIVGVQEAAKLSISLAVLDFATQVLLVILGFVLVFSPTILVDNIHWGVAPTWSNLAIAIPVAMLAYTGRRDGLEPRPRRRATRRAACRTRTSSSPGRSSRSTSRCRWSRCRRCP